MGFFDRVGDFFNVAMDAVTPGGGDGPLGHPGATIGSAWAAANDPNSGVSQFLGNFDKNLGKYSGADKVVDVTTGAAGHVGDALSTAFSYAVGRPVSTAFQVDTQGTWGAWVDGSSWRRAWNRSENISAGQALSTDFGEWTGIGPDFTQAEDPYSADLAGARREYFDSWQGRMASGSVDLLLNLYADPTIFLGKAAKAAEASRNVVKAGDRAGVLAHATGGNPATVVPFTAPAPITARQAKQGDKAAALIDRIDRTPVGNIPAMPELTRSADAGAYAQLFQAVKDMHPEDAVERRKAIADVLGTAWGDEASMDRLVARKDGLARQMEALSQAPAITKNSVGLDAATKAALMTGKQSVIDGLKDQIDDQIVRMQNVINDGNVLEQPRVAGDIRGSMGYDRHLAGLGFSQTYLHTGSATPAVRVVSWGGRAATGRIPGSVHLKDSVNGYQDMNRVLGTMSHTAPEVKQRLLDSFVNATTPNHRMNVVKALNNQITADAGLKYGLTEDQIAKVIKAGGDEMNFWRTAMGSRLYSAAEDAAHVAVYDPEDDLIHGFAKPFMQSHIEDHHPVLDPAVMDKAMRKATGNRRLDKADLPGVADVLETAGRVINDGVLRPLTSLWKDAALVRLAYPLRILTDSFARLGVHMGSAQYVMTRWTGLKGVGYYALTNESGEKSLKNIFKEGDMAGALDRTFDLNVGNSLFKIPVEDREKIIRTVLSKNGGVADLGDELSSATLRRVRNGDWRIIPAPGKGAGRKEVAQYTEDYLRVINRQIKNSPSSMEFVKGRSLDDVAADVRAQLGAGGGPLAQEYRTVGKNFPSIEDWLAHPLAAVDHYLPIDDMRVKLLGRDRIIRPEGAPSKASYAASGTELYHGTTKDFGKFTDDSEEYTNRRGRLSFTKPRLYFTHDPRIAEKFTDGAWRHVDLEKGIRGYHKLGTDEARDAAIQKFIGEIKAQAKDGLRVQRVDHNTGVYADIKPSSITKDDILDDTLRIGKKGVTPRVIKAKVFGESLDIRKWADVPDDMKKSVFNNDKSRFDYWGSSYTHEHDPKLTKYMEDHPEIGKFHVKDSHESGGSSIIVNPKHVRFGGSDPYRDVYGPDRVVRNEPGFSRWDVDKFLTGKDAYVSAMPIHGEMYNQIEQGELRAGYNGLRKRWFTIMADMPETVLARAPLFWDSYRKNIQHQLDALPDAYIDLRGADAIRKSAMRQARKEMGRILYDASDASNMSHTMRYVSPFFTAWEDTMRKWSGLIYDNPAVLPRINQLAQSANDAGIVQDANGNRVDSRGRSWDKNGHVITDPEYQSGGEFLLLPKKLTSWIPGPLTEGQVKIRKDSINSVFQGDPFWLPGFGPMVQVPANKVVRDVFPKETEDPVIKYLLPYGTTTDSAVTQLLPKWARSAKGVFGSGQQFSNQYAVFLAEATVDARKDGSEVDLNKVKNRTRNYFILKAITDNASPVSVVPDPKYQLYIDKAHEYRNDKNRSDWIGDFMKDFPGYGEMGISLSANNTGITASNAAFDATKKYRKDIAADPEHGWMIVGPANAGGAFSGGVYDWQATHEAGFGKTFRGKQDPQSAIRNLQVQQGWSTWNSFMTQVNLALKDRGLMSTQQSGAEDLQWAVGQAREALAKQNGAWGDAQASASHGGAGRLIGTAQDFLSKHAEARSRPDMVALQQYMDFRIQVKQALAQRSNKSLQYNPDLAYALEAGAKQLVENNIGFEAMFNRVLQYDDLSDIKVEDVRSVA